MPLALGRPLHGDGHRLHDGRDGGGARHDPARQRRHPRVGLAAARAGRDVRAARRGDGARARAASRREILTAAAFDNAIRADMAIGGCTNAIVHLIAIAGRAGVPLPLARFDELSRTTPLLRQRAAVRAST